jgi:hypothetical protein
MPISENHDVFVWGFGILGKGPALEFSKAPTQIPNTLFGCNEFSPDVVVKSVHAGVNIQGRTKLNLYNYFRDYIRCLESQLFNIIYVIAK